MKQRYYLSQMPNLESWLGWILSWSSSFIPYWNAKWRGLLPRFLLQCYKFIIQWITIGYLSKNKIKWISIRWLLLLSSMVRITWCWFHQFPHPLAIWMVAVSVALIWLITSLILATTTWLAIWVCIIQLWWLLSKEKGSHLLSIWAPFCFSRHFFIG